MSKFKRGKYPPPLIILLLSFNTGHHAKVIGALIGNFKVLIGRKTIVT